VASELEPGIDPYRDATGIVLVYLAGV